MLSRKILPALFLLLLSQVVSAQCPDDFYAGPVEESCDSWIFEIGSFVEGEAVYWDYGDGTSEFGGHFTDHTYSENGTYEVCGYYWSPLCTDSAVYCETIIVECAANVCELDMEVVQDGDVLYFTPYNYPDDATIFWSVNGNGAQPGDEFTFTLNVPGTYQICAGYETPDCPQGVFWCETWTVEDGNDCPGEEDFYADNVEGSCTSWIFEIGSFVEGEEVFWEYGDGTWEWGGHFTDHLYQEEGEYEVCAYYHSPLCPDTVILCQTIFVECGENPCELDMEVEQDGDTLLFYPFNYPDNATIFWQVNGESAGEGDLFSISIADPGTYEICALYETPECPQAVWWCETWTVEGGNDCPSEDDFYAGMIEESCDHWIFEIGSNQPGIEVYWTFGDGDSEWAGHVADHNYEEDGVYEVCAVYYGPFCPNGITYCQTIEVSCAANECELDMEVVQDGDVLYFTPYNYPDDATIFWSVNGNGAQPGDEFTFTLNVPGTYQICAGYETPDCPQGVLWCETWTVEDGNDCPGEEDFYADNVEGSCTSWIFEIGSFVEGEEVFWEYGDGTWEWGGHFTDHLYQEEGEYEVCAHYHSPLCPDTVILCQTILVECGENPCELDMEVEQDGDTLLFYPFNYPDDAVIGWQVNGEWYGTGEMFSISIAEPGTYQVCASYETPECPQGVTWCETWTVEDEGCPFEMIVEETEDCGCYELALNGQWGSQYYWNLGDTSFTNNSNSVFHCFEPGNYTGYVQIFGSNYPDCEQQPVLFSLEVPDCEGDCPTALTYEELECGLYEFTIEGGSQDADVFWNFGNQAYQSDGSPHTHFFEEGFYTVYIMYFDENCQSETYIVELEVPDCGDPECTWFEFEVATNAAILPIELDWSMTSQQGTTAGAGSVSLSEGVATFTGEVCLMAGCYTLTLISDFPIGLENFEFDFPIIPGLPINIDWIQDENPYTLHTQIDLAGDCDWSVGLGEEDFDGAVVYPVPASDFLNIRLENDGPTEVRFFDAQGKLLKQQTISQTGQLDIAEFSAGYYILQLQRGDSFKTFSIPLLN